MSWALYYLLLSLVDLQISDEKVVFNTADLSPAQTAIHELFDAVQQLIREPARQLRETLHDLKDAVFLQLVQGNQQLLRGILGGRGSRGNGFMGWVG